MREITLVCRAAATLQGALGALASNALRVDGPRVLVFWVGTGVAACLQRSIFKKSPALSDPCPMNSNKSSKRSSRPGIWH